LIFTPAACQRDIDEGDFQLLRRPIAPPPPACISPPAMPPSRISSHADCHIDAAGFIAIMPLLPLHYAGLRRYAAALMLRCRHFRARRFRAASFHFRASRHAVRVFFSPKALIVILMPLAGCFSLAS